MLSMGVLFMFYCGAFTERYLTSKDKKSLVISLFSLPMGCFFIIAAIGATNP